MDPISGVVVAGGVSRRLGEDKRRLRLWGAQGPTLLERTVETLRPLCDDLVVVLNDAEAWAHVPARLTPDSYQGGGALGGIYAGLMAARQPYALVVAGDMPLLSGELLRAMAARRRDYDALVPRRPEQGRTRNAAGVEPLHAIYSRRCLPALRAMLERGERRIADFLSLVSTAFYEADELQWHDPGGLALLNVNTPEDLAAVRRILAGEGGAAAAQQV